ncbi:hypothetical protein RHECNPAF_280068 [Rhizobium etli CNPAF512]|nr:hypothetical protein RHECNPAF_280068 [Rhizobium etli CNPAF512]
MVGPSIAVTPRPLRIIGCEVRVMVHANEAGGLRKTVASRRRHRTHGQLPPQTQGQILKCSEDYDLCESSGTPEFQIWNSLRTNQRRIADSR